MKVLAVLSAITLSVLLLLSQVSSLPALISEEKMRSGAVQTFGAEEAKDIEYIVESLLQTDPRDGIPKVSLSVESDLTVVRLVFPSEVKMITELTEEIQLGIIAIILQLNRVGLALDVKDKHELIEQFVILAEDETPILASLEKLVVGSGKMSRKTLKLIDPSQQ